MEIYSKSEKPIKSEEIVIPLKRCDQINDVMPYLKNIARPGMKVVFLVRGSTDRWPWMEAHLTAMQTGNLTAFQVCELTSRYNVERETRLAEESLALTTKMLCARGISTEVKIYASSLRKALRRLAESETSRLVLLPTSHSFSPVRISRAIFSALGLSKRRDVSPVLLVRSSQISGN
jgi:hypothetical protein